MKGDGCAEMRLLIQADMDGELRPAEAARVGAHLETCADCTETQARLTALSEQLRREVPYHTASAALRARVAALAMSEAPTVARAVTVPRASWWQRLSRPRLGPLAPFGAGFAIAACLALVLVLPRGDGLTDTVVAGHIRALQPGHLMDVVSTDQHTVKPWFDGRLTFAPPVKDFKAVGFPLEGARLDYLADRQVAALVYQRQQHLIDLFVWPDDGHFDHGPAEGSRSGYNFLRWSRDGMAFWAVSDLNAPELADFVRLWQAN
ncbi:MAG TPA: anti-sigma factor [Stellaceae bacterium]|nr:anti-sigma factor [Stellaceae bacterium]